ncbi:MAG: site-specific recombinase [Actinoplanes sp.]|nr:site-specific recombinase [Actinoplanes sp.]
MVKAQVRAGIYSRQSRDKTKSIDEQTAECQVDAGEQDGWTVAEVYSDGVSASRFGTKARPDWDRLLADVDAGRIDALVLWESSRGDRDAETWLGLLTRCRVRKVLIRITSHERTYNMALARDWKALADDGIDSAYESEKTSLRMLRAMVAQARDGKPAGRCVYGYERHYGINDEGKRVLVEQIPHPEHALIVAEIVRRVAAPEPIQAIVRDLNARGVAPPSTVGRAGNRVVATRWRANTIRDIATRVDYTGKREYRGETYDAVWPEIVTEAHHLAARRVLTDPARKGERPSKQKWLLSYLVRCGAPGCGEYLHRVPPRASRRGMSARYACTERCLSIQAEPLDELVLDAVVLRLAEEEEFDLQAPSNDAAVLAAQATVGKLQERLDEWRDSAARGETSPASLARIEAQLLDEIATAGKATAVASTPPLLLELLDGVYGRPDAIGERVAKKLDVVARRELIRYYLDVTIAPSVGWVRSDRPLDVDRVLYAWKR